MKSRQRAPKTRRATTAAFRTKTTPKPRSRRAPALERAHLSCLLCGRKGDVELPVGMLLAGAPHELICAECLTRHPTDHSHAFWRLARVDSRGKGDAQVAGRVRRRPQGLAAADA